MDEEAVKWGNEELQAGLTYGEVVLSLVKQTFQVLEDTMQIFRDKNEDEWDAVGKSELPKVEEELHHFVWFALIYWWQKTPYYTQDQKRILEKVLLHYLEKWLGDDGRGRAMWDTLRERIVAYGQSASMLEQKDESLMVADFAFKLSEYCGIPYLSSSVIAPILFTTALKTVFALKPDKRESRGISKEGLAESGNE